MHKKLPQSTVKRVLPSNESYESKTGCNRTLATVLWVPLRNTTVFSATAFVVRKGPLGDLCSCERTSTCTFLTTQTETSSDLIVMNLPHKVSRIKAFFVGPSTSQSCSSERTSFGALWKTSRSFCEISCGHFPWKLNRKAFQPEFGAYRGSARVLDSPSNPQNCRKKGKNLDKGTFKTCAKLWYAPNPGSKEI